MTLPWVTTQRLPPGMLARVNMVAILRSEPVERFVQGARDGLALTLVCRSAPRPTARRWPGRLAAAASIVGVAVITTAVIAFTWRPNGHASKALGVMFVGLLLLAPRFRLTSWRLGLLGMVAVSLVGNSPKAATIGFSAWVALFCVAATVAERVVLWWMCVLMLLVLWLGMPLRDGQAAVGMTVLIVAAAVAMDAIRGWRQTRQELEIETQHAEREQARRAVLEERARIGRELHDVVAHHMSLIAVQAETAPYRVGEIPESVSSEFAAISAAARTALVEMRRLLALLRNDEEATLAPQPQIEQIDELIATARSAGIAVDYTPAGVIETVPQSVGVCAYRIVQEALTNASRHAPDAAVTVQLVRNHDAVRIEVSNGPGRAAAPGDRDAGPGQGLTGMRERASLLGGALTAGPTTDGGFSVTAVLPLDDT